MSQSNYYRRPKRRFSAYGNKRRYGRNPRNRYSSRGNWSNRKNYNFDRISNNKYIMKAQGEEAPSLYVTDQVFDNYDINDQLKFNINRNEYKHPTKIQDKSIPEILKGKDIMGLASTGSGKTAAFLIPLINKVMKDFSQKCIIIVPTRELASQINDELYKLTFRTNVRGVVIIGGESAYKQIKQLERGPQFIIGTPGRLKDLTERRKLNLEGINNVVLDEVDRMLDMGFVYEIKQLISKLQKDRQSLFFCATMSSKVEVIANSLLSSPVRIEIEKQSPTKNVDQDIVKVQSNGHKLDKLQDLLEKEEFEKVLIFSRTKRRADKLSVQLNSRGFKVDAIHGDKSQYVRTKVINKFKNDVINVLVATDVAARGLDIPLITHVINYDEPANYDDYIHRIGRTGRIGQKGFALTFVV